MIENLTQFVGIGLVGTILAAWRAVPILCVVLLIDLEMLESFVPNGVTK